MIYQAVKFKKPSGYRNRSQDFSNEKSYFFLILFYMIAQQLFRSALFCIARVAARTKISCTLSPSSAEHSTNPCAFISSETFFASSVLIREVIIFFSKLISLNKSESWLDSKIECLKLLSFINFFSFVVLRSDLKNKCFPFILDATSGYDKVQGKRCIRIRLILVTACKQSR